MSTDIKPEHHRTSAANCRNNPGVSTSGNRCRVCEPEHFATPAPLDPAKVKAGDTVTLENGDTSVRGPVVTVEKALPTDVTLGFAIKNVGWRYLAPGVVAQQDDGVWTLTDHQPAPEPEPEPEPGASGTATLLVGADANRRRAVVRLTGNEFALETPLAWADLDGNRYIESEVTDFVPDEPRPLPTLDEMAEALEFAGDDTMHRREHAQAMLQFLRGESR